MALNSRSLLLAARISMCMQKKRVEGERKKKRKGKKTFQTQNKTGIKNPEKAEEEEALTILALSCGI